MKKDDIYSRPQEIVGDFCFDQKVAAVFPDMIKRSVPGYVTMIGTIGELAARYVQAGTNVYDLGCSLGEASLAMRRRIRAEGCRIIAVDNSEAMIERAREHVEGFRAQTPVELVCADVLDIPLENASMVVLNFTLQFIQPEKRPLLLEKVCRAMNPGGILVLSEKIRLPDAVLDELNIELHHEFKRAQGYSELEISQKRTALENVLIPESLQTHLQRLRQAGFSHAAPWYQCFNFASIIALK